MDINWGQFNPPSSEFFQQSTTARDSRSLLPEVYIGFRNPLQWTACVLSLKVFTRDACEINQSKVTGMFPNNGVSGDGFWDFPIQKNECGKYVSNDTSTISGRFKIRGDISLTSRPH